MANITIKELIPSDKISDIVDKINFNFDQLLLNGGGPRGLTGGPGETGPIGPRGTLWFTAADLYTTPDSPNWSITANKPERANDINSPNYPIYTGNPNKYLPVADKDDPQGYPENTFVIGNENKMLRDGDLYIEEYDANATTDNPSNDGNIWEYDGEENKWIFTGVNIKGETGQTGSTGLQQWIRDYSTSTEVLYPMKNSGQDSPRIFIGAPEDIDKVNLLALSTFLSSDINPADQIAIGHSDLHTSSNPGDMALISVNNTGQLLISGSQATNSLGNNRLILQSFDASIQLTSNSGSDYLNYIQNPIDKVHNFTGAPLLVESSTHSKHIFTDNSSKLILQIANNDNINISSDGTSTETKDIVLQEYASNKNVGIGTFNNSKPRSKLSVLGNSTIGLNVQAAANGLSVQGPTKIGAPDITGGTIPHGDNMLEVSKDLSIINSRILFNAYVDNLNNKYHITNGISGSFESLGDNLVLNLSRANGAGNQWSTPIINAFAAKATTGYIGYGTQQPKEKIHVHKNQILITEDDNNIDKGMRLKYESNIPSLKIDSTLYDKMYQYIGLDLNGSKTPNITIMKDDSNFKRVGVNTKNPDSTFEVSGEGYGSVLMGNFNNKIINNINRGNGIHGTDNLVGTSWIGINSYVNNSTDKVVFKATYPGTSTAPGSGTGILFFSTQAGALHIALDAAPIQTQLPGGNIPIG